MKRKAFLTVFLLITITLCSNLSMAEQVEYLSFEGFSLTADTETESVTFGATEDGIWKTVKTITVSLPNKKYLAGFRVKWHVYVADDEDGNYEGASHKLRIKVNDNIVWTSDGDTTNEGSTDYYDVSQELFDVFGDTFTVTIEAYQDSPYVDDDVYVTVDAVYLYYLSSNYGIKSKLTELKYIPPGADNTATGFILNQTEVHLSQSYTLSEGSVSFYIRWDGSTNIKISDNIGINADGYIYIKNDDGTTWTLEGVNPPTGEYVPVYIAWRNGEGYIMLNNTKLDLNWEGSVTFTKVGDISQSSGTLIDEFRIYDNYIMPEQFLEGEDTTTITIEFPSGTSTVTIQSDDGTPLSTVQVSLFDENNVLIANDTYDSLGETLSFNVDVNATYAVFTTPTGSTTVYIYPNETITVAVPGQSEYIQATIEPATYPTEEQKQWIWLIVKDSQDRLVYRNKWDLTATPVILRVGGTYLISVATENFTKVQGVYFGLANDIIKINLPKVSELTLYDNLTLFYDFDPQAEELRIYYYDPQASTANVSITFYDAFGKTIFYAHFPTANLINFKTTILPYKFNFEFTRGNETHNWTQTVGYVKEGEEMQEIIPKEFMGLALIAGILFAFGALSAEWAPVVALIFGSVLGYAGLISFPGTIIGFMSAMSFMAFASNMNLSATSLRSLTIALVLTAFAISVGVGIANYYGYLGWGSGGYSGENFIEVAGRQVVFWQEYTPTYSEYGVPLPTDAQQGIMPFIRSILLGFPQLLMSLGAPKVFALSLQGLIYAGMAAVMLAILFGREV